MPGDQLNSHVPLRSSPCDPKIVTNISAAGKGPRVTDVMGSPSQVLGSVMVPNSPPADRETCPVPRAGEQLQQKHVGGGADIRE